MRAPVITAWDAISPLGHGAQAHLAGLAGPGEPIRPAVEGFDVRQVLGRAGTRAMDRVAGLTVATTARLLEGAGLDRQRRGDYRDEDLGLVLGASDGVRSVTEFLRDTWTRATPYDVDPAGIPRTLMNFAAGQCAIWHRLKGLNTTVSAAHTTALLTLNYARRMQLHGHARAIVWGAVEECSPERERVERAAGSGNGLPPGEGCVMFLLEDAATAAGCGRTPLAEVLAVGSGVWHEEDAVAPALAGCLRRTAAEAGLAADGIVLAAPSAGRWGGPERAALKEVFGEVAVHTRTVDAIGDTRAASAAFQLAEALTALAGRPGATAVVTSTDGEGRFACALLRAC